MIMLFSALAEKRLKLWPKQGERNRMKLEMVEVELEVVKVELAVEWVVVVKGMARIPHRG